MSEIKTLARQQPSKNTQGFHVYENLNDFGFFEDQNPIYLEVINEVTEANAYHARHSITVTLTRQSAIALLIAARDKYDHKQNQEKAFQLSKSKEAALSLSNMFPAKPPSPKKKRHITALKRRNHWKST